MMMPLNRHKYRRCKLRRSAFSIEALERRCLLAGAPKITEFQAINDSTLRDEDGDFSDWIEIRNPSTQRIDLAGWYLTDNGDDLTKWQFPKNSTIEAQVALIVFASGKNRWDGPQGQHHTNFRLSGNGETLALVRPDGVTIAQSFDSYPSQVADQSYGLAVGRQAVELVGPNSSVKTFIPTDDSLRDSWQFVEFDDTLWQPGTLGVGYETLAEGFTLPSDFSQPLSPEWTIDLPSDTSSTVTLTNNALQMTVPKGDDLDHDLRGTAPIVSRAIPEVPQGVTWDITAHLHQSDGDKGTAGIAVLDQAGLPVVQVEYSRSRNFRVEVSGRVAGTSFLSNLEEYFLRLRKTATLWSAAFKVKADDPWQEIVKIPALEKGRELIAPVRAAVYARSPSGSINAVFDQVDLEFSAEPPKYGPRINTDVAAMNRLSSSVYLRIPFQIDVDPTGFDEMTLAARVDDGFAAYLNGVLLTTRDGTPLQVNAFPNPTWNSVSTVEVNSIATDIFHHRFDLSASIDLLRQGENLLTIHGMNADVVDKDFFFDATLAAAVIETDVTQVFLTPTPGALNVLPAAPKPILHGSAGLFFGTTTVEMTLPQPIPSVEIRYTLDGSEPTPDSTLYNGPVKLSRSAMLQARAFDFSDSPRFAPSNRTSGTFIALDPALRDFSSNLPILLLDGFGDLPDKANTLARMNVAMLGVSHATGRSVLDAGQADIDYLGRGGARDRGASTSNQAKPNMTFETWGITGTAPTDDENVGWLGLTPESDWVLHAPFFYDPTYARNPLVFDISNQMDRWAPHYRFVEVYLDSNNRNGQLDGNDIITPEDFMGIYVLMEKIKQGPGRLDIAETTPDHDIKSGITGGYIWKLDRVDPDAGTFTAGDHRLNWVHPKSPYSTTAREDQKATELQQQWVVDYFDAFMATLDTPDITDSAGYSKYIDPASWVDLHLIHVFLSDPDAFTLSSFLFKDEDQRIESGPVWDFDRTAESRDNRDNNPDLWSGGDNTPTTIFELSWFSDLFRDPGFWQLYIDRWQMWRESVFSDDNLVQLVDGYHRQLAESAARSPFEETNPRNHSPYFNHQLDGTFRGEFNNLNRWLIDRAHFFDKNFAPRPDVVVRGKSLGQAPGTTIRSDTEIEIRPAEEEIFHDEKLIDPVTSAGSYLVIGDDTLGDTWTQLDFDDSEWNTGLLGFGYGTVAETFAQTIVKPRDVVEGSTTFLTRVDFEINDLDRAQSQILLLRVRYDDALSVYLNGEEIQAINQTGAPLAWNGKANPNRTPTEAFTLDLTPFTDLLVEGTNTMSFRVINMRATDRDMLVQPTLISREVLLGINPDAIVYYTLDGTDPRAPDGQPSKNAVALAGGGTIHTHPGVRLTVRSFDTSFRGNESQIVLSDWSGPRTYDLVAGSADTLIISEINYHPSPPNHDEMVAGFVEDDFEFVEIRNTGTTAWDLTGIHLSGGIESDLYRTGEIDPAQHVLVVSNPTAFKLRYGDDLPVVGKFTGQLGNDRDRVELRNGLGDIIFSVKYDDSDPWQVMADGMGSSLELKPHILSDAARSKWYQWQASPTPHGTPGADNSPSVGIVINEILASPANGQSEAIELYNMTESPFDVSGWFLSDSPDNLFAYQISAGTVIPAKGYAVLHTASNDQESFAISGARGDSIYLVRGIKDPAMPQGGHVTQYVDDVHFGPTLEGESLGRLPNGTGRLSPLKSPSLNELNDNPRVGPLLITEVQFNPLPSAAAITFYPTIKPTDLQFVEVGNATPSSVDLTNWRLRGGTNYDFVAGTSLDEGQTIVVVNFNPQDPINIDRITAFREHYEINERIRLVGADSEPLNDADDIVVLLRPDVTRDMQNPPHVIEDEVVYDNLAPWPEATEKGFSIQRRNPTTTGNDSASWFAAGVGSPGRFLSSVPGDFNSDAVLNAADIDLLFAQMRSPTPDLAFDFNGDHRVDAIDRDQLVIKTIGLAYGDANLDGRFDSEDLVAIFVAGQYDDNTVSNSTWSTGDWDGDGEFDDNDLAFALQQGQYESE